MQHSPPTVATVAVAYIHIRKAIQLTFVIVVVQRCLQIDLHRSGTGERRLIATVAARRTGRVLANGQQVQLTVLVLLLDGLVQQRLRLLVGHGER